MKRLIRYMPGRFEYRVLGIEPPLTAGTDLDAFCWLGIIRGA
jgi:hypothetical protein